MPGLRKSFGSWGGFHASEEPEGFWPKSGRKGHQRGSPRCSAPTTANCLAPDLAVPGRGHPRGEGPQETKGCPAHRATAPSSRNFSRAGSLSNLSGSLGAWPLSGQFFLTPTGQRGGVEGGEGLTPGLSSGAELFFQCSHSGLTPSEPEIKEFARKTPGESTWAPCPGASSDLPPPPAAPSR